VLRAVIGPPACDSSLLFQFEVFIIIGRAVFLDNGAKDFFYIKTNLISNSSKKNIVLLNQLIGPG